MLEMLLVDSDAGTTMRERRHATSAARATSQEQLFGEPKRCSMMCTNVGMTRTKGRRNRGFAGVAELKTTVSPLPII
jgi:hypothetical protein